MSCIKSGKFNRREPLRETAKKRKALIYKIIILHNSAQSLRNTAVIRLFIQPLQLILIKNDE